MADQDLPQKPAGETQSTSRSDASKPAGVNSTPAEKSTSQQLTGSSTPDTAARTGTPIGTPLPTGQTQGLSAVQQRDQQAQAQVAAKQQAISSTDAPTDAQGIMQKAFSDPSVAREQTQKAVAARIGDPGAAAHALSAANPGDAEASLTSARLADERARQDVRRIQQENIVKAAPELAQKFTAEANMAGLNQVRTMLETLQQPENRGVLPAEISSPEDSEPRRAKKSSAARAASDSRDPESLSEEIKPHESDSKAKQRTDRAAGTGTSEQSGSDEAVGSESGTTKY